MDWLKAMILTALFSATIADFNAAAMAADWGRSGSCRRGEPIQIQDLDMRPDPVIEGQRVRFWRINLRYDGRGECETNIYVREGNNIAGALRNYTIHNGMNEIQVPANDGFRFRTRESCFNVQVDLEGSRRPVDAEKRFCATQRVVWSMREPEDRGRFEANRR
ncbi:MAG: hypothetical protein FJ143_02880 [Deltaproteobacteria bacterium]|nr:hypothetical protein [Deltaproteobacteria bacterium]MBM4296665.1 hypothetical protein [Deltaproteobacteria bacterium]